MAEDVERPTCTCHGEPMASNGLQPHGRRKWQCAVGNRERVSDWYWVGATNLQLAGKALKNRRLKALRRMEARS